MNDNVDFMEKLHALGQKLTAKGDGLQYLPNWVQVIDSRIDKLE